MLLYNEDILDILDQAIDNKMGSDYYHNKSRAYEEEFYLLTDYIKENLKQLKLME